MRKSAGMMLAGIWLAAWGVLQLVSIVIPYIGIIMAALAIVAGFLLIFGK